jgi:class 3 adenylate cyclase
MYGFIIFTDLKNYSKLTEDELEVYCNKILPDLAKDIDVHMQNAKIWNTWGDAIIAVFENGKNAVNMALDLRDFFKYLRYDKYDINKILVPRIAGHFGNMMVYNDSILKNVNVAGINVNTTARLEPKTRPGEVFVTKEFKEEIIKMPNKMENIKFSELGEIELAKNFGDKEVFRVCRKREKDQIIDRVFRFDMKKTLPDSPGVTAAEGKRVRAYESSYSPDHLLEQLDKEKVEGKSGEFVVQLANICRKFGLYEKALEYIDYMEGCKIEVDGIDVYPLKSRPEVVKNKVNCLTRLGKYEKAADLIYGLWQSGNKDSDTLSMLAAQYKRRALYNTKGVIDKSCVNFELLKRAKNIYLEAFRIDISNFYPAINAAYLCIMIKEEEASGHKLATYIEEAWGDRQGENWWLDATLAEAELLQYEYRKSLLKFKEAMHKHTPYYFDVHSTFEQINSYAQITNKKDELASILNLLSKEE